MVSKETTLCYCCSNTSKKVVMPFTNSLDSRTPSLTLSAHSLISVVALIISFPRTQFSKIKGRKSVI